jgi:hypothetical protein
VGAVTDPKEIPIKEMETFRRTPGPSNPPIEGVKMANRNELLCTREPQEEEEVWTEARKTEPDFPAINLFKRNQTSLISHSSDGKSLRT